MREKSAKTVGAWHQRLSEQFSGSQVCSFPTMQERRLFEKTEQEGLQGEFVRVSLKQADYF
jgi:hypothetical protein